MRAKIFALGALLLFWFRRPAESFTHTIIPKSVKVLEPAYLDDAEWSHGEVAWDFPNETPSPSESIFARESETVDPEDVEIIPEQKERDKIWEYLQQVEIRAGFAGIMKSILHETQILDSILLDDIKFKSTEFETMIGIFVVLALYNNNKRDEIDYMRTVDIEKYTKIRRMASIWMISVMVVFTKNVKDAF
jgi:hypothetical protein